MADKKTIVDKFQSSFPTGLSSIEIDVYEVRSANKKTANHSKSDMDGSNAEHFSLLKIGEERLTDRGVWEWRMYDLDSDNGPRWTRGVYTDPVVRKIRSININDGLKQTFNDQD